MPTLKSSFSLPILATRPRCFFVRTFSRHCTLRAKISAWCSFRCTCDWCLPGQVLVECVVLQLLSRVELQMLQNLPGHIPNPGLVWFTSSTHILTSTAVHLASGNSIRANHAQHSRLQQNLTKKKTSTKLQLSKNNRKFKLYTYIVIINCNKYVIDRTFYLSYWLSVHFSTYHHTSHIW